MQQQTQRAASAAAPVQLSERSGSSSTLQSLRGLSYAEQTAALSPSGDGAVQMKGPGAQDAKPDPATGLPEEVVALGLKRVTVTIQPGAWEMLDGGEQKNVLSYLQTQEERAKKNHSRYAVAIGVKELGPLSDEELDQAEADAAYGSGRIGQGKSAYGKDSAEGPWRNTDHLIGVKKGTPEIKKTVLPADERPDAASFDAASTFPSAKYKPEDMNNEAFNKTLETAAAYLAGLRERYGPDVSFRFTVEAGESLVTPPKGMKTGDLARLRSETAIGQAKLYFEAQGIDTSKIVFDTDTQIGTTPYERGKDDPDDERFTKEQFLRVSVDMIGDPPPTVIEEKTTDASAVTISKNLKDFSAPGSGISVGNGGGGPGKDDKGIQYNGPIKMDCGV